MGCAASVDNSDNSLCSLHAHAPIESDGKRPQWDSSEYDALRWKLKQSEFATPKIEQSGEENVHNARDAPRQKFPQGRRRGHSTVPLAPWPQGDGPWSASTSTDVPVVIHKARSTEALEGHEAYISDVEARCFPAYPMSDDAVSDMLRTSHVFLVYVLLCPGECLAFSDDTADNPSSVHAPDDSRRMRVFAGYVSVKFCHDNMSEVLSLAVEPCFQGIGIGSILLSFVLSVGGLWQLHVCADNVVARRLYKRHGFRAIALVRRYYPDGKDAFIMRCHMQPDA